MENKAACVRAVLTECPDHDLANLPLSCEHGGECSSCWCQHSQGETVAAHWNSDQAWLTCRAVALNATTGDDAPAEGSMEAESESDGCMGDWIPTNAFYTGEMYAGRFDNASGCVAACKTDDFSAYDMASVEAAAVGGNVETGCWCQKSGGLNLAEHYDTAGSNYWTCRVSVWYEEPTCFEWNGHMWRGESPAAPAYTRCGLDNCYDC